MRGRKKTNETRLAIVRCAAEIFSQREFHEVLTDDIAHRLGIGKGTIYRYFGSKEELYLAAIGEGLNGLHAAVTTVLQQDAPLETTIEAVVRTMVDLLLAAARLLRADAPPGAEAEGARARRLAEASRRSRRHDPPGARTRRGARRDRRAVNARLAVEVLFGMIRGVCVYRARQRPPRGADASGHRHLPARRHRRGPRRTPSAPRALADRSGRHTTLMNDPSVALSSGAGSRPCGRAASRPPPARRWRPRAQAGRRAGDGRAR